MSFASLIGMTPAKGMKFLKGAIEQTLQTPVENFDLIYIPSKSQIDFKVYNYKGQPHKIFKYDESKKLCILIDTMLKNKLGKIDFVLDVAKVSYQNLTAELYYTKGI